MKIPGSKAAGLRNVAGRIDSPVAVSATTRRANRACQEVKLQQPSMS
jgi:hypothetical protein